MSFKEQLQKKIDDTVSATPPTSTGNLSNREQLEMSMRMQMALFDSEGPTQIYLNQAYNFLLCIPPTSVECERVFSSAQYISSHLKCSLKDDSIDALSFLSRKTLKNVSNLDTIKVKYILFCAMLI